MSRNPKTGGRPSQKPRNIQDLINTLNESELHALNHCIGERLRYLQQQRAQQDMTPFRIGDTVRFTTSEGRIVTGVLIRLNKKSVSIHTEEGQRWTVSPHLLTLVRPQFVTIDNTWANN